MHDCVADSPRTGSSAPTATYPLPSTPSTFTFGVQPTNNNATAAAAPVLPTQATHPAGNTGLVLPAQPGTGGNNSSGLPMSFGGALGGANTFSFVTTNYNNNNTTALPAAPAPAFGATLTTLGGPSTLHAFATGPSATHAFGGPSASPAFGAPPAAPPAQAPAPAAAFGAPGLVHGTPFTFGAAAPAPALAPSALAPGAPNHTGQAGEKSRMVESRPRIAVPRTYLFFCARCLCSHTQPTLTHIYEQADHIVNTHYVQAHN